MSQDSTSAEPASGPSSGSSKPAPGKLAARLQMFEQPSTSSSSTSQTDGSRARFVSGGSLKDRIAKFNQPSAPPVLPPSGIGRGPAPGSGAQGGLIGNRIGSLDRKSAAIIAEKNAPPVSRTSENQGLIGNRIPSASGLGSSAGADAIRKAASSTPATSRGASPAPSAGSASRPSTTSGLAQDGNVPPPASGSFLSYKDLPLTGSTDPGVPLSTPTTPRSTAVEPSETSPSIPPSSDAGSVAHLNLSRVPSNASFTPSVSIPPSEVTTATSLTVEAESEAREEGADRERTMLHDVSGVSTPTETPKLTHKELPPPDESEQASTPIEEKFMLGEPAMNASDDMEDMTKSAGDLKIDGPQSVSRDVSPDIPTEVENTPAASTFLARSLAPSTDEEPIQDIESADETKPVEALHPRSEVPSITPQVEVAAPEEPEKSANAEVVLPTPPKGSPLETPTTEPDQIGDRVSKDEGRGMFIVFEGLDRSGKSTQVERLANRLRQGGDKVKDQKFPDRSTPIGTMIDAYLKDNAQMDDRAIHLLFGANRWELARAIEKDLNEGVTLIADRYAFSGIAFSAAKGLDPSWLSSPDVALPAPDLTLYLTVTPSKAAERGEYGSERYENLEMQERVREEFAKVAKRVQAEEGKSGRWVEIDADGSPDEVAGHIWQAVQNFKEERLPLADIGKLWTATAEQESTEPKSDISTVDGNSSPDPVKSLADGSGSSTSSVEPNVALPSPPHSPVQESGSPGRHTDAEPIGEESVAASKSAEQVAKHLPSVPDEQDSQRIHIQYKPRRELSNSPETATDHAFQAIDDLNTLESKHFESGYEAGLAHGKQHGLFEGRELGQEKAFEIWEELGYMEGFAKAVIEDEGKDSSIPKRATQHASTLIRLVNAFPTKNPSQRTIDKTGDSQSTRDVLDESTGETEKLSLDANGEVDISLLLERIRARYKLLCTSLGTKPRPGLASAGPQSKAEPEQKPAKGPKNLYNSDDDENETGSTGWARVVTPNRG